MKSDNNIPGFKHSKHFPSMQSFELQSHGCVSTRLLAVDDNISLDFRLEFIPFAKSEAFLQTSINRKCVGFYYCKQSPYAF